MPIMTRMRDSMPLILFGLLIAFLITIVFEWGMDYMGIRSGARSDVVGVINGRKVTYQEFSEMVQTYAESQKAQTGTELDEAQLTQVRDQIWQSLVQEEILKEQMVELGVQVTDQELVDWVRGDNPPEDLRRNFIDSTGQFRRDVYEQFLADPNQFIRDPRGSDPAYGSKWLKQYEESLRQRRMREKLQSLVGASVRVSEGEVRQRFSEQNEQLNALYAFFDPNQLVKDADVSVSDEDLKAYYEENLEQYKLDASRKLKYVTLLEKPSASDSAMRLKDMEDAVSRARAGADFLGLVFSYSERPDSGAFFRHGELAPSIETPVFSGRVGDLVGPIQDDDGMHLLKILDERKGTNEYVRASHILFSMEGDTSAVRARAGSVIEALRKGKDFASAAKEYSKDPLSADKGGDLGWFTRGRMVPQFETAAFKGKIGEILGPIRTSYGLHILKITGRDNRELKLAQILMRITPSPQTKSDLYDRARDFAYTAADVDFSKAAQEAGFTVQETEVREKGGVIPGIGFNESLTRWCFKHRAGEVSDPFTIPNGYVVVSIAESKEAGVKPFAEVKESLQPLVLRKKKLEKARSIAADHRRQLAGSDSLPKLSALNPSIPVQETGPFTLGGVVPGVGRDPVFIGTVSGLKPSQISQAVLGQRGAFLVQLISRSAFDSVAYNAQRDMLRTRLLQEKRSRFASDWMEKLKENADIEDNREMFFR